MNNNHSVSWNPPKWWRTEEQQIERAQKLFGSNIRIPDVPKFVPLHKKEVPLLSVNTVPFLTTWGNVGGNKPPRDFKPKAEITERLSLREEMQVTLNPLLHLLGISRRYRPSINWLRFPGCANYGSTTIDLDNDPDIIYRNAKASTDAEWVAFDPSSTEEYERTTSDYVGKEVFSALIQFPDWMFSWEGDTPIYLKGYGYYSRTNDLNPSYWIDGDENSHVQRHYDNIPCLRRLDGSATLELSIGDEWGRRPGLFPRFRKY